MCKKCTDALNELFPNESEEFKMDILWNLTSFPCGDSDGIIEQLRHVKDVGPDVAAREFDKQCDAVMAELMNQEGKDCACSD